MQETTLWRRVLGVEQTTVIETIEYDDDAGIVTAHVRPSKRLKPRCGRCGAVAGRYDQGEGRRRWRALDLGTVPTYLEAEAPRVRCAEHGVTVAQVPWARHGAGHTRFFDDQTAWLATVTSKSAATEEKPRGDTSKNGSHCWLVKLEPSKHAAISSECAPSTHSVPPETPSREQHWRAPKPTNSATSQSTTLHESLQPSGPSRNRHDGCWSSESGNSTRSSAPPPAATQVVTGQHAACDSRVCCSDELCAAIG
ncbi:transposase [Leucobacter aridicollis]|nr:transposase [Leucobacter aridicollis]